MVIYIHGFGGSGLGVKASLFREYFKRINEPFIAPSLSYVPDLAIQTLEELIDSFKEVYLIGSSLGGYYASYLASKDEVKKVVLINPSMNPTKTLKKYVGEARNFYDDSYFLWSDKHIKMLERYHLNIEDCKDKFLVLLQTGDEILDYKEAESIFLGYKIVIQEGGSHSFDNIEQYFELIKKFFAIGDSFKHTSRVKGIGLDNKELAKRVGDLYYDDLAMFLDELSKKIYNDASKDNQKGRIKLAKYLYDGAKYLNQSAKSISKAWNICEIPTINWMKENGCNRQEYIKNLKSFSNEMKEWYFGSKITMPNSLYSRVIDELKENPNSLEELMLKYHDFADEIKLIAIKMRRYDGFI